MKYLTCAFSLLFLLLSNVVSAGLLSWPSQTFSRSRYIPATVARPDIRFFDFTHGITPLKIHEVRIIPDNFKPCNELTVNFEGYLSEVIDEGVTVEVEVRVGIDNLISTKIYDLCRELWNNRFNVPFQCPIQPGNIRFSQKVRLEENIPEELIHIMVRAFDRNRALLAHFAVDADFYSRNVNRYLDFGK